MANESQKSAVRKATDLILQAVAILSDAGIEHAEFETEVARVNLDLAGNDSFMRLRFNAQSVIRGDVPADRIEDEVLSAPVVGDPEDAGEAPSPREGGPDEAQPQGSEEAQQADN